MNTINFKNETSEQRDNRLRETASRYDAGEKSLFIAEVGFEEWMDGMRDIEGNPVFYEEYPDLISDEDTERINNYLGRIFDEAHEAA